MRLIALFVIFALSLSSYCAAAHAFGEIPMQGKTEGAAMISMPDCPGMQTDTSTQNGGHHPAKTSKSNMACKACCASLTGFPMSVAGYHITEGHIKFPLFDSTTPGDFQYKIFHPPKSLT